MCVACVWHVCGMCVACVACVWHVCGTCETPFAPLQIIIHTYPWQILVDLATNNKARSGVDMKKGAMMKVKGKDDYTMTFTVESLRANKNQRLGASSESEMDLKNPFDLFSHQASFISCSHLDAILAHDISLPPPAHFSSSFPLSLILVMNFDSQHEFQKATQFPPVPGGVRLLLQENGGDVVSTSRDASGSAYAHPDVNSSAASPMMLYHYTVTALFSSDPGESLICTRENPHRPPETLLADASRCILDLSQVKSFGIALGRVTSTSTGRLWVTLGPPIVEAHEAAVHALDKDLAVVAGDSCTPHLASLPDSIFTGLASTLTGSVTSLPDAKERNRLLSLTDAAFSQRLYILLRRKRTSEFNIINSLISASLPTFVASSLSQSRLLNHPRNLRTKTSAIYITLNLLKSFTTLHHSLQAQQIRRVIQAVATFMAPFSGSLIGHQNYSRGFISVTAVVSGSLDAACYVALSLRALSTPAIKVAAILTASIKQLIFSTATTQFFNPPNDVDPLLSDTYSLCHKSAVNRNANAESLSNSPLINFQDHPENSSFFRISNAIQAQSAAFAAEEAITEIVAGRVLERAKIDRALAIFLLGISRQMILIEGPSGYGKSVLTNEFLSKVKQVSCLRHGPYQYYFLSTFANPCITHTDLLRHVREVGSHFDEGHSHARNLA